nr:GntR family transcriptional regulator [uncultured Oscillibacter sp.]
MKHSGPLYAQIAKELGTSILSRRIAPGEKLPPVRQIAAYFRANPQAVCRAVSELEKASLVQKQRGTGMYSTQDISLIASVRQQLVRCYVRELRTQMDMLGYSRAEMLTMIKSINARDNV